MKVKMVLKFTVSCDKLITPFGIFLIDIFNSFLELTTKVEPMLPPLTLNTCPGISHDKIAVELMVTVGFCPLDLGILRAENPNCSCKSQYNTEQCPSLQYSPGGHWQSVIHPCLGKN